LDNVLVDVVANVSGGVEVCAVIGADSLEDFLNRVCARVDRVDDTVLEEDSFCFDLDLGLSSSAGFSTSRRRVC
jgi:hypothetical protein